MRFRWSVVVLIFLSSWFINLIDSGWTALWPSIVALVAVFLLNRTITGLLLGAGAGLILLHGGNPLTAVMALLTDHLIPVLQSSWNLSVLAFTLLLGGFAALLEKGGGLQALTGRWLANGSQSGKRVQWSAYFLGLVCFFDGLANSMLVGKSISPMAEWAGVSKQRLAYIVDSTSSAVACVAVISTWIAYQLAMIREGLSQAGVDAQPFGLFLKSIPFNFYCWFTLILLAVVISKDWNIGPMRKFQGDFGEDKEDGRKEAQEAQGQIQQESLRQDLQNGDVGHEKHKKSQKTDVKFSSFQEGSLGRKEAQEAQGQISRESLRQDLQNGDVGHEKHKKSRKSDVEFSSFQEGSLGRIEVKEAQRPRAVGSRALWQQVSCAVVPLVFLISGLLTGLYVDGVEGGLWPLSFEKVSAAYGNSNAALVLVWVSALACVLAFLMNFNPIKNGDGSPLKVFGGGVKTLIKPILILISAWLLSSVLKELKAHEVLTAMLRGTVSPAIFPVLVFITGALISFSTGTSWGTMGILMPLALPSALGLADGEISSVVYSTIAAVFSGAVFGDHCSPFSDTTIVSSISCGIEPMDHVRTQMPYALIASAVAIVIGFLPTGLGFNPYLSLVLGTVVLFALPTVLGRAGKMPAVRAGK